MDPCSARFLTLLLLLAVGSCASLNRHRAPSEALALFSVHRLNQAQSSFHRTHRRYAQLQELGPDGAALISAELTSGNHDGYIYRVAPSIHTYTVVALPENRQPPTIRSFFSDQTGVIRESYGPEPASATSKAVARSPAHDGGPQRSASALPGPHQELIRLFRSEGARSEIARNE